MIQALLRWLHIDLYEPVVTEADPVPNEPDELPEIIRRGRLVKDRADRHSERAERVARSWEDLFVGDPR